MFTRTSTKPFFLQPAATSCRSLAVTPLVILMAAGAAFSQDLVYYAPHGGPPVRVTAENAARFAERPVPTKVIRGGATTYNVTYQDVIDGTGFGFDDATEGPTRRATVDAVIVYLDGVLGEAAGATIDIHWDTSLNDLGSGTLASMGTFFFVTAGFSNGIFFQHITTGVDPSGSVDITGRVNFGHDWNSDHTQSPSGSEFDLFSVVLHELTHGVGISSLSDADGISEISNSNPGKYSIWDQLMRFSTSTVIWNAATTALETPTSVFTSDNLSFSGSNATSIFGSQPPVYAPTTFANGSSLAHFKTGSVDSVMVHAIPAGVERRAYTTVDIATLIDLGYTNASGVPVVSFSSSTFSVDEDAGSIFVTVNITQAPGSAASVDFASSAGTATAGVDYVEVSDTLNFASTDVSGVFEVVINDDFDDEGDETITLTLSNATAPLLLGAPSIATLTIVDNDGASPGQIDSQSRSRFVEEGQSVTLNVTFSGTTGSSTLQWLKDNAPLADGGNISGATMQSLTVDPVSSSDSGSYVLRIQDESKGLLFSDPIVLTVVAPGSLPAAGMLALGLLSGAIAASGALALRRKRR